MDVSTAATIAQLAVMLVSPAQIGRAIVRPIRAIHCHLKHNCPAPNPKTPKKAEPKP